MRNPYEVLGLTRSASADEIKKAFRKQAKRLHPDANKNDPGAAVKFAELNAAYEIVGDADKRKAFDRGEIDAEGKPRFQGFDGFGAGGGPRPGGASGGAPHFESFHFGPGGFRRSGGRTGGGGGGFGGFEDILSGVFGGGRGGARPDFGGFAAEDFGVQTAGRDMQAELTITLEDAALGARKRVQLPNGKDVEVAIPQGLADGQTIRLKGQGQASPAGGAAGDLLITVHVAPHARFKIDGADLRVDVPIALYEAVLGGKVRVPTLGGAVELAVPAGTSSGRTFRLRGKGLKAKGATGDLLVTVRIALPKDADPDLERLMQTWRDEKPYDPRE